MQKTLLALLCLMGLQTTYAATVKSFGNGAAEILKNDLSATRNQAFNNAKRDAVIEMIKQINGPEGVTAAQTQLDSIIKQVDNNYVMNIGSETNSNKELVTRVSLEMDDGEFRKILNNLGLAKKNSRTSPIMIVMDEFFGVPRDHSKPVKEFTAFHSDKSYSFDEKASYDASLKAKESSSASASSRGRASSASGYGYSNYYGGGAGYAGSSASYNDSAKAKSSSSLNASESARYKQSERQNDIQSFVKYVEYQTPSTQAERENHTLNAISSSASQYDLRLLDSAIFRSKYLKGKSMTIQQLLSDAELNKFVTAARQEKADWFMAGSTNIFDRGRSNSTGQYVCDGAVSFKIFSVDDGTLMGGDTRTELGAGETAEGCRTNVARKLGQMIVGTIGPQILDYSKNRGMYGKELTFLVKSTSGNVSSRLGDDLFLALEEIKGAENINVRTQDGKVVELTMTYKSEKPITVELARALRNANPALANAERLSSGNTITLCIGGTTCK